MIRGDSSSMQHGQSRNILSQVERICRLDVGWERLKSTTLV